jgi:hypothetical protein
MTRLTRRGAVVAFVAISVVAGVSLAGFVVLVAAVVLSPAAAPPAPPTDLEPTYSAPAVDAVATTFPRLGRPLVADGDDRCS